MQELIIRPKGPLSGTVSISGSKNAALPIIAATLLGDSSSSLAGVPALRDVENMLEILRRLGAEITQNGKHTSIRSGKVSSLSVSYTDTAKLRASFLIAGPLLAKYGYCRIARPGGCQIGTRPIDLHLKGFAALGASIDLAGGDITLSAGRLCGTTIYLDFPSVGATENIMMAACLAEGETILENAATEPEIQELAIFLEKMGADIQGAGTDTIKIRGVSSLSGTVHSILPDRIEAGTFMVAAAITGGQICLENVIPNHLKALTAKLQEMGVQIQVKDRRIFVEAGEELFPTDIKTLPYPGFPTDMQPQLCALLSVASGTGMITETVFENRFLYVPALKRMGADITIEGRAAIVKGRARLSGAHVSATDLRAGAALVLAALRADGETRISNAVHIARGYAFLPEKLRALGAVVEVL